MFTGIIERTGTIDRIDQDNENRVITVSSAISDQLRVDQSVSHQGVCLTVVKLGNGSHQVVAVAETIRCTTIGSWEANNLINLERCLPADGRLDGHIVQGHVDQMGQCVSIKEEGGSWLFEFQYDDTNKPLLIEKGSIAVNGVSLTCFNVHDNRFSVAVIPFTYSHTQFQQLKVGDGVNLEFDVLGKYMQKMAAPYLNRG